MRESALQARDKIFVDSPNSNHSQLTRLASISRAVWYQDFKLANILVLLSDLGREHLLIERTAVSLLNPLAFEEQFLEAKAKHFEKERGQLNSQASTDNADSPGADRRATKRTSRPEGVRGSWVAKTPALLTRTSRVGWDSRTAAARASPALVTRAAVRADIRGTTRLRPASGRDAGCRRCDRRPGSRSRRPRAPGAIPAGRRRRSGRGSLLVRRRCIVWRPG